jgi:hypothetical protein
MIILNNAKEMHFQSWTWKPHQDYSPNGVIEYERGTLHGFKAALFTDKALIGKMFGETVERDNTVFVLETVAQFPFKNDDIVIDDMGKEHIITNTNFKESKEQGRFLRTPFLSRKYYLAVEGDE